MFKKIIINLLLMIFVLTNGIGSVHAQQAVLLPVPGTRMVLSGTFAPPLLKGVRVYRNDPFRFDFVLDKGDTTETDEQLKADSKRLIKYFLASLTVPEKDLWVNLSPYEKNRIVPNAFGQTEMGRDILAQDYILKQITASVLYPEGEVGKEFWAKVYAEAQKRYGTTDVPVDTFNKVWIIPAKATVFETNDAAFVVESKLKVMLEEDYLALEENTPIKDQPMKAINKLGSDVVREVVLPILEKEVNEGKNFSTLRQVYYSLILATWYKRKVKASIIGQAYVDKQKTAGIDIKDKSENEKIWQRYVEAFNKGAYNLIKEEYDPATQTTIPRKHFSGGTDLAVTQVYKAVKDTNLPKLNANRSQIVQMRAELATKSGATFSRRDFLKSLVATAADTAVATYLNFRPEPGSKNLDSSIRRAVKDIINTVSYMGWRRIATKGNFDTAQFIYQNLLPGYQPVDGSIQKSSRPSLFFRQIPGANPAYVAAFLPGTGKDKARNIVFSAHFDARHQGADDNSSGIATLMALSRAVSAVHFRDNIYFVFTNDEEVGKLGARVLIKDLQDVGISKDNVVFIDVDSIGQSHLSVSGQGQKAEIWLTQFTAQGRPSSVSSTLGQQALERFKWQAPYGIQHDNISTALELLPSDGATYDLYGFPALTISGISWDKAKQAGILNTNLDTPNRVSMDAVYEITRWLLFSLNDLAGVEQGIFPDITFAISPFKDSIRIVNHLQEAKSLFASYDLTFESEESVSLQELELLSRWLAFVKERFPGYKKVFKGIKYDLTLDISHAEVKAGIIECSYPLSSKDIWLPYGFNHTEGAWFASLDLVLSHELGHLVHRSSKGENAYVPDPIGDVHSTSELIATDFAIRFLYGSLDVAPQFFIDKYLSGTFDPKTGKFHTLQKVIYRDVALIKAERNSFVEDMSREIGVSLEGGWPMNPTDLSPYLPPIDSNLIKNGSDDDEVMNPGGIDLDSAKMDFKTQYHSGAIEFDFDPAMLQRMQNASGISPVIVGVNQLESLSAFLGAQELVNK